MNQNVLSCDQCFTATLCQKVINETNRHYKNHLLLMGTKSRKNRCHLHRMRNMCMLYLKMGHFYDEKASKTPMQIRVKQHSTGISNCVSDQLFFIPSEIYFFRNSYLARKSRVVRVWVFSIQSFFPFPACFLQMFTNVLPMLLKKFFEIGYHSLRDDFRL